MDGFGLIKFDKHAARTIIWQELTELQARIADNMRAANEVASGKTIRSMHVESREEGGMLLGRAFFSVLETGRGPGGVPKNFYTIIRRWMKDKGVHGDPIPYKDPKRPHKHSPQERGDISMAWAIVFMTKKRGSKLFRDKGRSDIYSNEIPVTIQRINDRLFRQVTAEVKSIKLNNYEQFKGGTK